MIGMVLGMAGALPAAADSSGAGPKSCFRSLVKYYWLLDLDARDVHRVGKAPDAFVSCDEFLPESTDNVALEVYASTGKVVYRQTMFVPLTVPYDYPVPTKGSDGRPGKPRYAGGALPGGPRVPINAALPESVARFEGKLRIRFLSLPGRKVLGEGSL